AYVARYLENDGYTQLAEVSFSVTDNTAPVITLTGPPNITIDAGQPYEDAGATAIDNADGNITQSIQVTGVVNVNKTGIYTITFNVKDKSGNAAATVIRTVTVADVVPPVITLIGSAKITIPVGGNYTDAGATAIDDVDGAITSFVQATGEVNVNKTGIYTITFNVKDKSGNAAATVIRTITVGDVEEDVVPPVITLNGSPSVTISVGGDYTDAGATAHDNSDGDISSLIQVSGVILTGKLGIYTMTFNVKDKSGNAAEKVIRTITVEDQTSPVMTLNGSQAVTIQFGDVYEDAGATARDNVDGNVTSSIQVTGADNVNQPGVHTITFNVKDKSGNASVPVVRTVTVVDDVPPVITLNGSLSVTIYVGETYTDAGATAWDNADGDISSLIEVSGIIPTGSPGVFTRTYKVRDQSGNTAESLVRIIRVIEYGPPALQIARNADGTFTIRFEGRLQTTRAVNASWRALSLESPAVLSADQAAAFFRAKR
ncbi:MAG: DUF5011 domain-containing protein, partial [Verrucomicrobiota bacterium]|nr:DUF5011 domain-containing protein [Verrucomicrobiota bacterium]